MRTELSPSTLTGPDTANVGPAVTLSSASFSFIPLPAVLDPASFINCGEICIAGALMRRELILPARNFVTAATA